MFDADSLAKFIRGHRTEAGLTQQQLADQLGLARNTLQRWECGHGLNTIVEFFRGVAICRALSEGRAPDMGSGVDRTGFP